MIRDMRMRSDQLAEVKAIYRWCHPEWPMHSDRWFYSMNVLVITYHDVVVAWSAMSFSPPPTADLSQRLGADALCCWLVDTCVSPAHRNQGYAGLLMDHRLDIAYDVGCQMAIGAAHQGNSAMVKILVDRGFTIIARAKNVFPDGTTGNVYIKHLGGYDATHRRF